MLFETDFIDLSGDLLSEMRLLAEGAINRYEDEAAVLTRLASAADTSDIARERRSQPFAE